ncbi:lipid asymmetry maintenance protein MlaB [Pseudomonadota bacterium]
MPTQSDSNKPAAKKKVAKKKTARKKAVRKKVVQKKTAVQAEEQKMATPNNDATESNSFDLGESLTIMEVADIHQKLIELLDKGEAVALTANDVENIDGAGLQLLAAFVKDAGVRNLKVCWGEVSEMVREAAGEVGLVDALGLPEAS